MKDASHLDDIVHLRKDRDLDDSAGIPVDALFQYPGQLAAFGRQASGLCGMSCPRSIVNCCRRVSAAVIM